MAKKEKIKKETYRTEEQEEVIRFIKILAVVLIVVLIVYGFTKIFVSKDTDKNNSNNVTEGNIDYEKTIIGTMFNRNESEYYVIIYNSKDVNSVYYSGLVSNYKSGSKGLAIYTVDLNNSLNAPYITNEDSEVNVNTMNLDKFRVKNVALLKISNNKIAKALAKDEDIARELASTKEE